MPLKTTKYPPRRMQNTAVLLEEADGPEAPTLSCLPLSPALEAIVLASKHNMVPQGLWLSRRTSANRS